MDELTHQERDLILSGLFELRITHDYSKRCAALDALAAKLGGDPDAVLVGIDPLAVGRAQEACVRRPEAVGLASRRRRMMPCSPTRDDAVHWMADRLDRVRDFAQR